ncbi:MAG TPA: glycosyltransferase [Candidatus Saccharimonadales bacterium]|nr:glycosyltransferase [Candidatus Saccharimonadales bacterium]
MKIGIDVSQLAYHNTGVANYLKNLVSSLVKSDRENEYILFFSSLRGSLPDLNFDLKSHPHVSLKQFKFPPTVLDLLWNKLHVLPIENLIGDVDIFITSDWTEPPSKKAKKMTILYDLIVYKHPEETDAKIVETQKRKLAWVKKETAMVLCISDATKKDAVEMLGIEEKNLQVVYPGI